MNANIKLPTKKNLSDQVATLIGDRIVRGVYEENHSLPTEEEFRMEFSVSRTAIREAMKMLASKGIVESRPKTGTRVLPRKRWNFLDSDLLGWSMAATPHEVIREFLTLRRAIEPQACAEAAIHASQEEKEQLLLAFEAMTEVDRNWSHEAWIKVDQNFHEIIYQASQNSFFISFGELLKGVLNLSLELASSDESTCLELHRKVMLGILNGDPETSRQMCTLLLAEDKLKG